MTCSRLLRSALLSPFPALGLLDALQSSAESGAMKPPANNPTIHRSTRERLTDLLASLRSWISRPPAPRRNRVTQGVQRTAGEDLLGVRT